MQEQKRQPADAHVAAILGVAVAFAGAAYPVTAAALRFTSASVITTSRALVGGLLMLPVLRIVGSSLPRTTNGWMWAAAISVGNVVLTLAGIAEGTRLAGAAIASVLLNSAPFFAAVFAWLLLGEPLTRRHIAGLVVGSIADVGPAARNEQSCRIAAPRLMKMGHRRAILAGVRPWV